ncbi:MAG: hypothetical protein WA777_10040 [Rhodanobacter sp.]
MSWLKTILREIYGLFVDDGSYAIAILIWLGLVWLVLPRLFWGNAWNAIILAVGLLAILIESVLRRARK